MQQNLKARTFSPYAPISVFPGCICISSSYTLHFIIFVPFLGFFVALACGGLGLIASALVKNINQFQTVYALLISPMFFFSGVFYPAENLPKFLQYIAALSPLYHGVKISQQLLWGGEILQVLLINGSSLLALGGVLIAISYRMIKPKLIS